MSYQYVKDESGSVTDKYIKRKSDGAWIPVNLENTDYVKYKAWKDAGNTPDSAD